MPTWEGFEFHELIEVPEPPRAEDDDRARRSPEDPDAPLAASLTGAHASLLTSSSQAPALVTAWIRPQHAGRLHILLGGRPAFPPAGTPMPAGPAAPVEEQPTEVLFPPGARVRSLRAAEATGLLDLFRSWVPCTGHPDALWAAPLSKQHQHNGRRGSFQRHAAHLRDPFAWLVIAEPLRPREVQPELDRLVTDILPLSRGEVGEANRIALERKQARHRELSRSQLGNGWRVRVLVGGVTAESAENVAALLCAAADLRDQPYLLVPAGAAGGGRTDEPAFVATTELLVALTRPPQRELPGVRVVEPHVFDVTPENSDPYGLPLGSVLDRGGAAVDELTLSRDSLNRHTFVCGATGSGKSFTVRHLLAEATRSGLPWLVVEPAKAEYARMANRIRPLGADVVVIRPGDPEVAAAGFNPLVPMRVVGDGETRTFPLQTHLDLLRALFSAAFRPEEPLPQIIAAALTRSYEELGWDVALGEPAHPGAEPRYPTLGDLQRVATDVIGEVGYDPEATARVHGFIKVRVSSLRLGTTGRFFEGGHPLDFDAAMRRNVVFEIEDVGDDNDKAFLMGAVLIQMTEYLNLTNRHRRGDELRHLTVIEEAHRLLRRSEPGEAGAAAKAVEMFAALLAEVRAYGEGLVIVEQIPSKLVADVIKNTAIKIVHRLPAEDDRRSVGATMNLDKDQSRYVVSLAPRHGAVFTDGMDRPLLVRVPDGKAAEEGATPPAPVTALVGRRSRGCGTACLAQPCTLREMTHARQLLARYPALTIWAELTVVAHLAEYPNPTLDPGYRRMFASADTPKVVDCALSHAVDDAVAVRSAQLQPELSPAVLAAHCCDVLRAALSRDGENHCADDDWSFLARPFRWRPVMRGLSAGPDDARHPDTADWERRYRRPIPGSTSFEQLLAVDAWNSRDLNDPDAWAAVTFGTRRPSTLEVAIGGVVADGKSWDDKAQEAMLPFAEPWPSYELIPVDRRDWPLE